MYLQRIRLRDWKAFVDVAIDFPTPKKKQNVILVGALNGYGKTSLLEAMILGLFGRDGLTVLARAVMRDGETERLSQSYDDFLQRALHAKALEQGRSSASVEVTLVDEEVVRIQRTWHFTGGGKHRSEDEEVRIYTGPDEDLLRIPRGEDREDFVRNFVAQSFLPVHLAQFFLFDGEQVQRLAKKDMSTQVKMGIEGMLGVPVLRELEGDLEKYAQARRNSVKSMGDETLEKLRAEVRARESELAAAEQNLNEVEPQIEPLKHRRDQLTRDLGSFQSGTYANLHELMERKNKDERERDRLRDQLARLLREDLALAMAGRALRERVAIRLEAEEERAKWENGKSQSGDGLAKLLHAIDSRPIKTKPPLTPRQLGDIRERVSQAWEHLWHPPPAKCAENYRHTYLHGSDRAVVLERLSRVEGIGLSTLRETLELLDENEKSLRKVDRQIAQQHGVGDKVNEIASELKTLNEALVEKEGQARELRRLVDGTRAVLNPKRQELARLLETHQRAQPALRRAAMADRIASLIETVVQECYPHHIDEVAVEMTAAFRAMAHKSLLSRIEIDADCTVRLLGDGGRDMRTMDASAGENQIFALSLIAAISRVSKRPFPIVMDTPLARLDSEHRLRVLKYFTQHVGEQVVLLSQPDEVHGKYLNAIRPRVRTAFNLQHEELGDGVGVTRVSPGYFEEV
jgi:DNA sulfur modification protein DndD